MATAATKSVGELAVETLGAARVFEKMGIDFCCGGEKSLDEACRKKGLELNVVLQAIQDLQETEPTAAPDQHWQSEPMQNLMTHIVSCHHQYVRTETPRIAQWLGKCVAAHGEHHPELHRMQRSFAAMSSEMAQHMAKEELILFPAIARTEAGQAGGNLAAPVKMMMVEHDHSGRDLEEVRRLSGDYTPPADACSTYRALYTALAEFEKDMRQHIHLENNILFPRALALSPANPDVVR
ncbi:MAG: iron-sulfur cluster repair di-iron protein [Terriglobales bacterium]